MMALLDLARQRQIELDEAIENWRQGPGAGVRLWCAPKCGNCCSLAVNTTLAEAAAIAGTLDDKQRQGLAMTVTRLQEHARQAGEVRAFLTGYRTAVGPCPLLDAAGNCSIYSARPLACRALLATRPPDWCGVNLAALPEWERQGFLTSLDREVVAWPTHYAAAPQEVASSFERGLVFAMIRTYGFGVTGNLPLLIDLAGQPDYMPALERGLSSFRTFLAEHAGSHPFLVQVHEP